MSIYLLDSNIISELAQNPRGKASQKILTLTNSKIATSIIVYCEIEFGLVKKGSKRLRDQIEAVLSGIEVMNYAPPAHQKYGEIRDQLRQIGKPIGPNDLLIAAHALALGATLVTNNEREFSRVSGLKIENWLSES